MLTSTGPSNRSLVGSESEVNPDEAEKAVLIKAGSMRKLKTMKKKYFVLNQYKESGSIRLDYFDNEKKSRSPKERPKRGVDISLCFSINRKPMNAKNKFAIALYTREDCFSVVLEEEEEMKLWLETLVKYRTEALNSSRGSGSHQPEDPQYEHVWQVNVGKKGLAQHKDLTGVHRLCLAPQKLVLVKVDPTNEVPATYGFSLTSIRRCGHSECYFCIEFGRSSVLGQGELWMQTEDIASAHSMHEAILAAMKSSKSEDFGPMPRPRSASTSESSKPISSRRSTTCSLSSPAPPFQQQAATVMTTSSTVISHNTSFASNVSSAPSSTIRDRCDSLPSRSRTVSEGGSAGPPGSQPQYTDVSLGSRGYCHQENSSSGLRPHSGIYARNYSYSPPSNNPLSPSSGACSTDSAGSSLSIEDYESITVGSSEHYLIGHNNRDTSAIPSQPPIREEDAATDDYLSMDPSVMTIVNCRSNSVISNGDSMPQNHLRDSLHLSLRAQSQASWSPISSPPFSVSKGPQQSLQSQHADDSYMAMSPGSVGSGSVSVTSSRRSSSLLDRNSTTEEGSYIAMAPTGSRLNSGQVFDTLLTASTVISSLPSADEGYLDMAPLSSSLPKVDLHILGSNYNYKPSLVPTAVSGAVYTTPYFYSPPKKLMNEEFPLEKVKSYFSPTLEQESFDLIKPVRSYSIGSRPQVSSTGTTSSKLHLLHSHSKSISHSAAPYSYTIPANSAAEAADKVRVRAHSMGSQMSSARERMKAKMRPTIESELGTIKQIEETCRSEKSSSAPVLLHAVVPRARSSTIGSRSELTNSGRKTKQDDLMEIDYTKMMAKGALHLKGHQGLGNGPVNGEQQEANRRLSVGTTTGFRPRSNSRSSSTSSGLSSTNTASPSVVCSSGDIEKSVENRMDRVNQLLTARNQAPVLAKVDNVEEDKESEAVLSYAEIDFERLEESNVQEDEDVHP